MRSTLVLVTATALLMGGVVAFEAEAAAPPVAPNGYVLLDNMDEVPCLAVRVSVPGDQAVSGLKWFNGGVESAYFRVLVASGSGLFPPQLSEAVAVADSVHGQQEDWSEVEFSEPVASLSGSLFLIMQYPAGYVPPQEGLPLGVGYQNVPHRSSYFVTADGEEWVKVSSGCQVLMEPVFCVRDSSMLAKNQRGDQEEPEDDALPKVLGVSSYPNPFNPVATIQLALPKACECSVRIFDLRGRLVRDFEVGHLEAGYHDLEWWGRDDRGQPASSGVYFAQIRAGDNTLNHRMIMVK